MQLYVVVFMVCCFLYLPLESWVDCYIHPFMVRGKYSPIKSHSFFLLRSVVDSKSSDEYPCGNATTPLQPRRHNVNGITLKVALDQNGGVACRSEIRPQRFTAPESLDMVHRLRAQSDAVLIGVGTAVVDNPSLLVRRPANITVTHQPLRVVIDPTLRLITSPEYRTHQLLSDGYPVVIYHCRHHMDDACRRVMDSLSSTVRLVYLSPTESHDTKEPRVSVNAIVNHLQRNFQVQHLMVEGGPSTARAFLRARCIDRCILVHAPIKFDVPIPSGITRNVLETATLQRLGSLTLGTDTIEYYSRMSIPWPSSDLHSWP